MSSSDSSDSSEDKVYNLEVDDNVLLEASDSVKAVFSCPYEGELLADKQWQENYAREREEAEEELNSFNMRMSGQKALNEWCTCGYCRTDVLQNPYECRCWQEIDRCIESLNKDEVVSEMTVPPACITLHPFFSTICLDRWSLQHAANKLLTKERKKYNQIRRKIFPEHCLQRVHLFYLWKHWKGEDPLPSCAYHAIRKQFSALEGETFHGYEDESSSDEA